MEVKLIYHKYILIFKELFVPVFQPTCFDWGQELLSPSPNGWSLWALNVLFLSP